MERSFALTTTSLFSSQESKDKKDKIQKANTSSIDFDKLQQE